MTNTDFCTQKSSLLTCPIVFSYKNLLQRGTFTVAIIFLLTRQSASIEAELLGLTSIYSEQILYMLKKNRPV